MSKPCQRINISVDRVNVNGSRFSYVALAVLNTIRFAVGELPPNSEAQYSIAFNTSSFRTPVMALAGRMPRSSVRRSFTKRPTP